MMVFLLLVLAAIIGIGFLVIFHELGHFVTAKIFGIKVETFSLGLGPLILKKKYGETVYGISAIPFGGYVKLLGMETFEEVDPSEENRTYRSQAIWKRVIVIFAGAFFNLILPAFLILLVLGVYGFPSRPTKTIEIVVQGSAASKAGFKPGDTIERIDGRSFASWQSVRRYLRANPGKKITVELKRNGQTKTVTPVLEKKQGKGFLGVQPKYEYKRKGPITTIKESVSENLQLIKLTVIGYYLLIAGKLGPPSKSLSGPIGIVRVSVETLKISFGDYLLLLSVISVNLGILNLLPILPLDGGHLLFNGIEAATGKPVRQDIRQGIAVVGLVLLISLMAYVTFLDIVRRGFSGL